MLYAFFWVDSPASEFYMPMLWNPVCSIFMGTISRKNNSDKIVHLHLGSLPSTACSSNQTCPHHIPPPLIGSGYFQAQHFPIQIPQQSHPGYTSAYTCLWRCNSVLQSRHIKFNRQGITQKRAYNKSFFYYHDFVWFIYRTTIMPIVLWVWNMVISH